jgi:hypothetical protein
MEAAEGIKKRRLKGVIECKEKQLEGVIKGMRNVGKKRLEKLGHGLQKMVKAEL